MVLYKKMDEAGGEIEWRMIKKSELSGQEMEQHWTSTPRHVDSLFPGKHPGWRAAVLSLFFPFFYFTFSFPLKKGLVCFFSSLASCSLPPTILLVLSRMRSMID